MGDEVKMTEHGLFELEFLANINFTFY